MRQMIRRPDNADIMFGGSEDSNRLPTHGDTEVAKGTGGGKATHSGTDYQNRCAGWFGVRILAEKDAALPLELPANEALVGIRCESRQSIDDVNLFTGSGGVILGQAKHTLDLGTTATSDFASVIEQFVNQFHDARERLQGALPSGRDLDPERDRLVILTGSESSSAIREALPAVLKLVRTMKPHRNGALLSSVAANANEHNALEVTRAHTQRCWLARVGTAASELEVGLVLELIHVLVLDVDPDGMAEREARTILRHNVLKNPDQADVVWKSWIENNAILARTRGGLDRAGLQRLLIQDGIELQAIRSYRSDIQRLMEHTKETLAQQTRFSVIALKGRQIKIARTCVAGLMAESEAGSLLTVGEPGAGKSGAQFDMIQEMVGQKLDVVMLAADGLASESLGELRIELGLQHEVLEVLENWPGVRPAYLVIDALDAARSDAVGRTLRMLIERAIGQNGRWRVVASIRKFDLRHSVDLKRLFQGAPAREFADSEFSRVRHLNVPLLADDDLAQVKAQSPELGAAIEAAGPQLAELIRVPFNLNLIAALLDEGVTAADMAPIATQIELLERYWAVRVTRQDGRGDARDAVLRIAAKEMVRRRGLRASRNAVTVDPAVGEPLNQVLSAGVLVEWQQSGSTAPMQSVIAFSHHLLFDYAASRLLLRGLPEDLVRLIEQEPDLALAIRPSIVLHFQYLWVSDPSRNAFWSLVETFQASSRIPEIAKTIGPAVAADQFANVVDMSPLVNALGAD